MPPFSVAWLVTQTDNGTGNQLTKVHHPQAPHPPDPPPPYMGQINIYSQKWLSLSCLPVQQWVIADFVCHVTMWPSSTQAKAQQRERENAWPPFSGPLPHLLPPLPCFSETQAFARPPPVTGESNLQFTVLAVDENSTMTRKDRRNKTSGLPLWMHGWNSVMSILIKHGGQPQPLDKGGLSSPHSELRPVWSEQGRDWLPSH